MQSASLSDFRVSVLPSICGCQYGDLLKYRKIMTFFLNRVLTKEEQPAFFRRSLPN